MIEIKNRWTGATVLSVAGANLRGANLRDAYLRGADLRYADLHGADLYGANLRDAYLCGADLHGANLRYADLHGADLHGADLRDANLYGADLRGADLRDADLRGANLRDADLRGAKMNWRSHDLISVLVMREAGHDVEIRKIAGLILVSKDWCWRQFLAMESPFRDRVLDALARHVQDGDVAPDELVERKKKLDAVAAAKEV